MEHLDRCLEVGRCLDGTICFVDHHVSDTRHVLLVKILDVHALDLVHTRDWEAHWLLRVTLADLDEVVECILQGDDLDGLLLRNLALHALPPCHVVGLGEEVITISARDRKDWDFLLDSMCM